MYCYLCFSIFGKNHTDDKVEDKTPAGSVNLLDDTLLESPSSVAGSKMSRSLPHRYGSLFFDMTYLDEPETYMKV